MIMSACLKYEIYVESPTPTSVVAVEGVPGDGVHFFGREHVPLVSEPQLDPAHQYCAH